MASTRKALARVPSDKGTWKPHPKSTALGHLAQLIAGMPGWITNMVTKTELDLAGGPGYSFESTETLLERFDKLVAEARAALASAKESDFSVPWSLKNGRSGALDRTARRDDSVDREPPDPSSWAAHGLPAAHRRAGAIDLRPDGRRALGSLTRFPTYGTTRRGSMRTTHSPVTMSLT